MERDGLCLKSRRLRREVGGLRGVENGNPSPSLFRFQKEISRRRREVRGVVTGNLYKENDGNSL
jgi:hypothetical protein